MTRILERRLSPFSARFVFILALASSLLIHTAVWAGQPAPGWPDAATVFGPRPLYSAGIKPTVIVDTFSAIDAASTPQRLQQISDAIAEWKLEGIAYAAYYSMGAIESDPSSSVYLAISAGAQSLDLDGTPTGPLSITHQVWRDYLVDSAKLAIDVGAEYILLDVATLGLGSFDDEALAGFGSYLATRYTSTELAAMGVGDAATFDYRQDLLGRGYTTSGSVLSSPPGDSLWLAWIDHHAELERDFFVRWTSTLASHAASRGQVVHLGVNRSTWGSGGNTQWDTADLMNITLAETFLDDLGYPFRNLCFDYKISLALGKRFWSWNEPGNTNFPANPPSTDHLSQLFTAETFANGGLNQVSMVWSDFFQNGLRVDPLVAYYDFPGRHPQLFNLPEEGEIGLFYSQAGESLDSGPMGRAFRSGAAILEASHRPYDVVFSGSARPLSGAELAAYKAVLLPDTRYLSDAEVTLLEDYLNAGGTLIGTGRIGDRDETGAAATRAITALFSTPGLQQLATGGRVIAFPDAVDNDITVQFYDAADGTPSGKASMASLLSQFESLVDPNVSRDVTSDLPSSVHVSRYLDDGDQSAVYHLVNYDYDMATDSVSPVPSASLSLPVPSGFDAASLVVSYMTPDYPEPQVLSASVNGNQATFTIPQLDIWAIVKLGSPVTTAPVVDDRPQSDLLDWVKERPDVLTPDGSIKYPAQYWKGTTNSGQIGVTPFSIPVTATDDHGLLRVDLYSRYSSDGTNWGSWTLVDTMPASGTSIVSAFTEAPASDGYYQFHSVAVDDAGQSEVVLPRDEIGHAVDATPPLNPNDVIETHGVQDGIGQSTVSSPTFSWTLPYDNLSGASEYWLSLRDSSMQIVAESSNQPAAMTSWSPGTLSTPGSYTLHVHTGDVAGNKASSEVAFEFVLQAEGSGNQAPTAASATITTAEDVQSAGTTPSVTDPDAGDSHVFSIETQAAHGTASVVSNRLVYTPFADFNGSDVFSFRATDSGALSVVGTASVSVSSVNDPPTSASALIATALDTPSVAVVPTVEDVDIATNGDQHDFTIVSNPTYGQAQIVSNALIYTPDPGYAGPDSFDFRATDLQGASVVGTAQVMVSSGTPAASEFNIDLGLHYGPPSSLYGGAAEMPGFWNEVGLGVSGPLSNRAGVGTSASVSVQAGSDAAFSASPPATESDHLLADFISNAGGAGWQVSISGLPAGDYWLWLYAPASLPTGALLVDGTPVASLPGNPGGGLVEGLSHAVVPLAKGSGDVVIQGGDPFGSGLAGLQIFAVPEPDAAWLEWVAVVSMACSARVARSRKARRGRGAGVRTAPAAYS